MCETIDSRPIHRISKRGLHGKKNLLLRLICEPSEQKCISMYIHIRVIMSEASNSFIRVADLTHQRRLPALGDCLICVSFVSRILYFR